MSTDSDADEKEVTKFIQTLCRVNPKSGYKAGTINVDTEYNEVSISRGNSVIHKASSKSYVVDAVLDVMPGKYADPSADGKKPKTVWATQSKVFDQVRTMIDRRAQDEGSDILILANGASGSGKTYTMFGESNFEDRGIVPRFVDYIYKHQGKNRYLAVEDIADAPPALQANKVLLSMMLVSGEQMTDVLHVNNPLRTWNQHERVAYSDHLGPIALSAEYVLSCSADELSDQLNMGLRVAATVVHSTTDLYASTSIVISMLILSGDKEKVKLDATSKMFGKDKKSSLAEDNKQAEMMRVTKVTFMELPSVDNPHPCPVEVDRLTGVSALYRAARSLQLEPGIGSGGGGGAGNPYVPGQFNLHHRKSIVNYMLQDSLYKYPNAIIINCLRGADHSYDNDITAMDLMVELSENFNTDGASRKQLKVVEWIQMLYDEVRQSEYGAAPDPFAEYLGEMEKQAVNKANGGKKSAAGQKFTSVKAQRRNRDVQPRHEYVDSAKSEAVLLRNKANFLKRLAQIFELLIKKDKASAEAVQRLSNYTLPFVPAFDVSMNTSGRGVVIDFEQLGDPANKVPFTDVLRSWLIERGMIVKYIKPKLSLGVYDLMDLGEDDDEEEMKPFVPGNDDIKQSTTGIAHGVPWSYEIEGMDPYAVLLSPNSGLADSYAKIPLVRGHTVIRGKTGNTYLSENQSMAIYTTSPTEKDTEKDVQVYRASIRDLVGENIIPQVALAILDKEIADEVAASLETEEKSVEVDEYEIPETEEKKKQDAPKEVVNFVYLPGPNIEAVHAVFRVENAQFLFLRPNNLLMVNGKAVKPEIYVNGLLLTDEIPLQDNDVVQLGRSRFLQIRVPVKPMKMNELNSVAREEKFAELTIWERGMVRAFSPKLKEAIGLSEASRRHIAHIAVNRELTAVMKMADRTPLHRMETYLAPDDLITSVYKAISPNDRAYCCNIVGASGLVNYWATSMRRYLKTSFELISTAANDLAQRGRIIILNTSTLAASAAAHATTNQGKKAKKDIEVDEFGVPIDDDDEWTEPVVEAVVPGGRRRGIRQVGGSNTAEATTEERIFSGSICCENVGDAAGKFMWNCPILQERLYLMKGMAEQFNSSWCARDTAWLDAMYEPNQDAFNDTQEDDLIGVGYLYLDSLQYLVDTNDIVPIVSLQGQRCGAIKIKGRAWVDKIETAPPYLTVDKETNLKDFDGKNCVLRLYFESLMDLPPNHCSSTYVRFNFFYHNKPYITTRHGGCSIHPFLHNAIRVDQRITGDFLEYIARGSLEMEVYGKRKVKETRRPGLGLIIKQNFLTGQVIPEIATRQEEKDGAEAKDMRSKEEEEEGEDLEEKIRELTINLQKSQNSLNTNKKIIDNLAAEKEKLEKKIERQEAKFAEFEETLPAKYRSIKGAPGSSKSGKNAPAQDGSAACTMM